MKFAKLIFHSLQNIARYFGPKKWNASFWGREVEGRESACHQLAKNQYGKGCQITPMLRRGISDLVTMVTTYLLYKKIRQNLAACNEHTIHPAWKYSSVLTCSCPRDWRLSAPWGLDSEPPKRFQGTLVCDFISCRQATHPSLDIKFLLFSSVFREQWRNYLGTVA